MMTFPRIVAFTAGTLAVVTPARAIDDYQLGPDSLPHDGVPRGAVTKYSWTSKRFPGTVRDYWVYVPAQYEAAHPACVMIFQDGINYISEKGSWHAPTVFDNLIHRKEIPVTIGIFINPGVVPPLDGKTALPRFNRSFEYDGLGDRYSRFLTDEILPEVGKTYNLVKDGNGRAVTGGSSGAIAAFTAAWERPQEFSRVFTTIGTFTEIRGGNDYPALIRKTEPKPLRVFMQDGSNDLNIFAGNWFLANQDMVSALEFAGYEVNHAWGDGGHNNKHGGSIFPDVLRWLWKDYPAPVKAGAASGGSKQPLYDILIAGEPWQVVAGGFKFTQGPAANGRGEVFFADVPANRIHKLGLDGKVTVFVADSGGAGGLMSGADGRLYAAQTARKRVVAYDQAGKETVLAQDIEGKDIAVAHNGNIYVTDQTNKKVWLVTPRGEKRVADTGIGSPNGVLLTPDQAWLYVADTTGQFVYSFQIQPDGGLALKQPYCHLVVPDGKNDSGADGLTIDVLGRLYVAGHTGIQICDQAGRVTGIISKPEQKWLSNVAFGGPNFDYLYATMADKLLRRKTKTKSVLSGQPPFMPPAPKL